MNFVEDLLHEFEDGGIARLRIVRVLAKYAGRSVYVPADRGADRRVQAALHMLTGKEKSPQEIVEILRTRYRISDRQAWRDIAAARRQIGGQLRLTNPADKCHMHNGSEG